MIISDEDSIFGESLGSVLTPGEESLSGGPGPNGVSARTTAEPPSRDLPARPAWTTAKAPRRPARTTAKPPSHDLDGDMLMSSGSQGSDEASLGSASSASRPAPRASLGSASSASRPAPRPAPCPVGCRRAALPAFGWLRGQATGAFRPPRLHTCPGLRLVVKPGPGPSYLPSGGSVVAHPAFPSARKLPQSR